MISNAPLCLVTGRDDSEIDSPVDPAHAGTSSTVGAFGDDVQQRSRRCRTSLLGTAVGQNDFFLLDFGFDGLPFRRHVSRRRLGFHAQTAEGWVADTPATPSPNDAYRWLVAAPSAAAGPTKPKTAAQTKVTKPSVNCLLISSPGSPASSYP